MPDITNDFDNNPNTDKRKQRDEEVNNDNLQPEQTKSERRTAPLSRNQIKQNANTIAHNEQQTNDKTKTQGQEL